MSTFFPVMCCSIYYYFINGRQQLWWTIRVCLLHEHMDIFNSHKGKTISNLNRFSIGNLEGTASAKVIHLYTVIQVIHLFTTLTLNSLYFDFCGITLYHVLL